MADITIVQLITPNIDSYAKYSAACARKYALTHGYQYYVQRSKTLEDLHINWTKIDMLKTALKKFSNPGPSAYVVLLDADTVIIDPKRSIESFIEKYSRSNTSIFMAADTPFQFIGSKKKPNAGFIIVKNDETGQEIIDRWIDAAYNDGKQYNDTHPRNQLVYWNCVEPQYLDQQVVLPKKYFHKPLWWVPGPLKKNRFLYHVTSTKQDIRAKQMKGYYDAYFGDEQNLNEVVHFLKNNQMSMVSAMPVDLSIH